MKHFFEQYGGVALGILAVLVLIAMITPVGNIIKTSLQGTATKFSSSMNGQLDDAMKATVAAQEEAQLQSKNPYRKQVMSVQTLYDVGEANLTDDDIVVINGIDCYVLKVEDNKAEMITKELYPVVFDEGGHNAEDVEGHTGTYGDYWTKVTYDYKYSSLRTWMQEFYINDLGSDSRILPMTISYYTRNSHSDNLDDFSEGNIVNQFVYPFDAREAQNNANKFSWTKNANHKNGFWTNAGCQWAGQAGNYVITYQGEYVNRGSSNNYWGARPVFWISLE